MTGTPRGAVVTGAAGDMGGGVAAALARDGYTVYAADLRPVPQAPGLVLAERLPLRRASSPSSSPR